jgi:fatty acid desaturase
MGALRNSKLEGTSAANFATPNAIEWRTVALAVLVFASWFGALLSFRWLPLPLAIICLGIATAWHSSLQHELIHGHPFRNKSANAAIGGLPLGLWLPYGSYRESHLLHHRNELLTDPLADPESWYRSRHDWFHQSVPMQTLLWINRTLIGRIVIGPWLSVFGYLRLELIETVRGDAVRLRRWLVHIVAATGVAMFAVGVAGVPLWAFLVGDVYIGTALILIRSFAEHRWIPGPETKSAIVRAGLGWRLLYLNNNLHHAHHERPAVSWYLLPAIADEMHAGAAADAGAGFYDGYREVFRRFAFRPFDQPLHPAEGTLEPWRLNGTAPAQT